MNEDGSLGSHPDQTGAQGVKTGDENHREQSPDEDTGDASLDNGTVFAQRDEQLEHDDFLGTDDQQLEHDDAHGEDGTVESVSCK